MGSTYAASFLRSHIAEKENMMILEKSPEKAAILSGRDIGTIYGRPEDCIPRADLVILAVKPQDTSTLFGQIRPYMQERQVLLSIMAGVKMDSIAKGLGLQKIIRAMPNLPAQIGMGMTAFTSSQEVTRAELVMVQNLLNTTGKTIYVESEMAIDASTAISGSGPAYVFYFMRAMMEAAREMGFNEAQAELLVSQTFMGAVELQHKSKYSCGEWIQKVASRGGTTEAALLQFNARKIHSHTKEGLHAALARAVELGEGKDAPQ